CLELVDAGGGVAVGRRGDDGDPDEPCGGVDLGGGDVGGVGAYLGDGCERAAVGGHLQVVVGRVPLGGLTARAGVAYHERVDRHRRAEVDLQERLPVQGAELVTGAAGHRSVDRLVGGLVGVAWCRTGGRAAPRQV